jgi:IS30 family transposase
MQYTQLKHVERIELAELYSEGKSISKIALIMGRSKSQHFGQFYGEITP